MATGDSLPRECLRKSIHSSNSRMEAAASWSSGKSGDDNGRASS